MKKCLLLGNGINSHLKVNGLCAKSIRERFINLFVEERELYRAIFKDRFDFDACLGDLSNTDNLGIESLARVLYWNIRGKDGDWSENDEERLEDIITCMALNAIFFDSNGKINPIYNENQLLRLDSYSSIFTLNYYEYWDHNHICNHLHGYFDLSLISEKTKYLLSSRREKHDQYKKAIISLHGEYEYVDWVKMIFAPEGIDKSQLVSVRGFNPSKKLFPANDLFLIYPRELYTDLSGIDELDIFGVSPYGDSSLINAINQLPYLRIFVYEKNTNSEVDSWKNVINTKYDMFDASEMPLINDFVQIDAK